MLLNGVQFNSRCGFILLSLFNSELYMYNKLLYSLSYMIINLYSNLLCGLFIGSSVLKVHGKAKSTPG